ncbi:MAG: SEC-C metal-binding domain-containing protein [Pseudomonadota bacterium]
MIEISQALLNSLSSASACMADIRELAGKFVPLSVGQIEPYLLKCVDAGEDRTVSRLLQVCAFNEVMLDPTVLCRCIGVCEEMLDSAPCFALQDESVVQPLLDASFAEALSLERKLYATRLAAELTVKFGLDPQPVRKALWKHEHSALLPHYQVLIAQSLQLLEQDSSPSHPNPPRWSDLKLADLLPEHKPHAIIGGNYTVRRPIPKLGRNDPCHCGSGKKYKKCCYAKDQELLRDASQYAGVTKSELKNRPGLIDDPALIYNMRAYELKRLKPSELSASQLLTGYQCALDYGLRELAFEMLVECEGRSALPEFDRGHFEDLIERVLEAGDLSLARKIRDHCREDRWYRPHAIQFRFDLLENPERFDPLEHDCRKSVCGILDEEIEGDEPLIRLAYDCASRYPALAIVFARAAIVSNPERHFDNEVLLDLIRDARVDLDLEPGNDPAESLFDWIENQTELKEKTKAENQEIMRLSGRLAAARDALTEKKQTLRDREQMLKEAGKKQEKALEPSLKDTIRAQGLESTGDPNREEALQRLRFQVASLKAEIGEQQEQRRQLRKQLKEERQKLSTLVTPSAQEEQASSEERTDIVEPSGRPILPEYTEVFRKTCATLPPNLVAKAILAAGRFAAQEQAIWRQTKAIQRLPEHYRIRISLDYRMIVRWQPGQSLHILDVIPRQDLESWIKRHG